jgi:hypothetical protein
VRAAAIAARLLGGDVVQDGDLGRVGQANAVDDMAL